MPAAVQRPMSDLPSNFFGSRAAFDTSSASLWLMKVHLRLILSKAWHSSSSSACLAALLGRPALRRIGAVLIANSILLIVWCVLFIQHCQSFLTPRHETHHLTAPDRSAPWLAHRHTQPH